MEGHTLGHRHHALNVGVLHLPPLSQEVCHHLTAAEKKAGRSLREDGLPFPWEMSCSGDSLLTTNSADLGRSRSSCRWTVWIYPAGHIMGGLPRSCLWMTLLIVPRLILALLNGKSRGMGPPFDDLSAPLLPSPCFSCSPVLIFSLCPKLPSFCYPPPFESYQPFPIQMCVNLIFQKIMRRPLIYLIYPDDFLLKYPFIQGIQPYWAEEITTTGLQAFSSFRREWDMPCLLSDPGISS